MNGDVSRFAAKKIASCARRCGLERQRLDKWLWHARVVKARTSAAALVEAGHVRINGVREKAPGHAVKAGDVLTIGLDRSVRVLKVRRISPSGAAMRPPRECCMRICRTARNNYLQTSSSRRTPENGSWKPSRFPCGCAVPALRNPLKIDPFRSLG